MPRSPNNARRCSRVGLFRNQPGDILISHADVLVTIGFDPVAYDPRLWNTDPNRTVIHIDEIPADIDNHYQPTMELRGDIADIDVTVVRTPLGVAETGSILVTEKEVEVSTAAALAEHLVVLLDPSDIVENLHLAYQNPAFQNSAYAVLLSGPSGSADIGGVTVHPAQGVTTLTVVLSPRESNDLPVAE
jgi:L-lactate utilization protein LutC